MEASVLQLPLPRVEPLDPVLDDAAIGANRQLPGCGQLVFGRARGYGGRSQSSLGRPSERRGRASCFERCMGPGRRSPRPLVSPASGQNRRWPGWSFRRPTPRCSGWIAIPRVRHLRRRSGRVASSRDARGLRSAINAPPSKSPVLRRTTRRVDLVLRAYTEHYNRQRPHRALALVVPEAEKGDPTLVDPREVRRRGVLGGLIPEYHGAAA